MNGAVVIFLDQVEKVNRVVEAGLTVKELFVQVLPLTQPATKIVLSNVPPFITDEFLSRELSRHGKVVSPIKKTLSGCKSQLLKHVVSHRRHLYMILNNRNVELNLRFHIKVDDYEYVIFATSSSMKCFSCGEEGHSVRACPGRGVPGPPGPGAAAPSAAAPPAAGGWWMMEEEEEDDDYRAGGKKFAPKRKNMAKSVGSEAKTSKGGEDTQTGRGQRQSEDSDSEEGLSDCSDAPITANKKKMYGAEKISMFLKKTKGKKGVEVIDFFPDLNLFYISARHHMSRREESGLTEQEGYRLKKLLGKVRRAINKGNVEISNV
uniref:CCHC-type domain-containing protein n=1 Tax=Gasterosteus aculeatus TaxID=69293 RepID=G3Q8R6_GASAC